jgi:hypothetical protein
MPDKQTVMRPIDVAILLKKITPAGCVMNGKQLAESLGISAAEVSIAMERNRIAGLVDSGKSRVNVLALKDFLVYGIRYCFPAQPGRLVRGMPTASSAEPVRHAVTSNGEQYVWNDPTGSERGQSVIPLYGNAPLAAKSDKDLYSLLAIVDSLRIGKSRERQAAIEELNLYLEQYARIKQ